MVLIAPVCLQPKSQFINHFPRKGVLENLKAAIISFSLLFACVLEKHFKCWIWNSNLERPFIKFSDEMHNALKNYSEILQYKEKVQNIIQECKNSLTTDVLPQFPYIMGLLKIIEDDVLIWFEELSFFNLWKEPKIWKET